MFMISSGFLWKNGEYGVTGGTILALSIIFWIPALMVLFGMVKEKMPNYYACGLLVTIYGFGGVHSQVFNISHQNYIEGFAKYPISSGLLLFWPGLPGSP
jgi:hypothetical protein